MNPITRATKFKSVSWGVADQAISSLSNFAFSLAVARTLNLYDFGAFSVALSAYYLSISVSRALATDPLIARYSSESPVNRKLGRAAATGTAMMTGLLLGCLLLLVGLSLGGALGLALAAVAAFLPLLVLQDAFRFTYFAAGDSRSAFLIDGIWTGLTLLGLFLISMIGFDSVLVPICVWGGSAVASVLVAMFRSRIVPRIDWTRRWLTKHRDLASAYVTEAILNTGGYQLSILSIGAVAGLATMGSIRSAILLFGPLNILFQGTRAVLVPEGVRQAKRGLRELHASVRNLGWLLVTGSALLTGILLAIPDGIGQRMLGMNWTAAKPNILAVGASFTFVALTISFSVGLRALVAIRYSLRAQLGSAIVMVSIPGTIILILGNAASGGGYAFAMFLGAWIWWRQYRLANIARRAATDSPSGQAQ